VGPDAALRSTAPDGATDILREPLSPLRGYDNPGLLLDPTAYAVGYSLPPALRADLFSEPLTQDANKEVR